jgi:hypothetical protein
MRSGEDVMKGTTWRKWRGPAATLGAGLATALTCATALADEAPTEAPPRWIRPGLAVNAVFGAQGVLTQSLGEVGSQLDSGGGAGFWVQANGLQAPWDSGRTGGSR